jgi:hypothetical protein
LPESKGAAGEEALREAEVRIFSIVPGEGIGVDFFDRRNGRRRPGAVGKTPALGGI